jgi:hypothetical protein
MTITVTGVADAPEFIVAGRSALGVSTAESLAVDASVDLAVDAADDLEVCVGVSWTGGDATTRIIVEGVVLGQIGPLP